MMTFAFPTTEHGLIVSISGNPEPLDIASIGLPEEDVDFLRNVPPREDAVRDALKIIQAKNEERFPGRKFAFSLADGKAQAV